MMSCTMPRVTLEQARAAKPAALAAFERLADVLGIGITRIGDDYALKINLREAPSSTADLPSQIDGVPVRVEIVGTIRKR